MTDAPVKPPDGDKKGPASSRFRRSVSVAAAMLLVAALFVVAFRLVVTNRSADISASSTNIPSVKGWQAAGGFQSRMNEDVAVAQSDPRVVYRLNHRDFTMERSGDGGGTWRNVALPANTNPLPRVYAVFAVSPLDANIVYLTSFTGASSPSCPAPYLPEGHRNGNVTCSIQYVSTNGGARWQQLTLPLRGQLTGMLAQYLGSPPAPLLAQDHRVYSLLTIDAFAGIYRLVASSDGVNWQTCDGNLAATDQLIASYLPSPTGATVWVTTMEGQIWRSDDAGGTWKRASDLPAGTALIAARTVTGKSFLYSAANTPPFGDSAPSAVQVSMDGGKTWRRAPGNGVPSGQHAVPHLALTRADGALVMVFRTPEMNITFDDGILHDAAFYAWTPGTDSWLRLTPSFGAEAIEQQWMSPTTGTGKTGTVWALIYRDPTLNYVGDTYIEDGTYTITSCALGK